MANTTIKIPRAHLVMALCLPLAVLLGYFLAEPMASGSMAVIVLLMFVLSVPLLMKWHHPLLVLSWNACIFPVFVPGQPPIWVPITAASLLFAVLNRSVSPDNRFIYIPSIAHSLLYLLAVVMVTAWANGGIGIRSLGGAQYGGRNYVYILMAVVGFFAFSSMRIPPEKAGLYVAMFFLSGLTGIFPNIIYALGSAFYPLFSLFPAGVALDQVRSDYALGPGIFRLNGLAFLGPAIYCYLFARYGIRGSLDYTKPWRPILLIIAAACCAGSGFRSCFIFFLLTFCAQFYFEGLHKTRLLATLLVASLLGAAVILPNAHKLPWVVQRAISFLPANIDPLVQENAATSTNWRLDIWKRSLPDIPKHLLLGKGYSMDPNEMFITFGQKNRAAAAGYDGVSITGDYHSGPLSLIIPMGIWGTAAFIWFLVAAGRYLLRNFRNGDPGIRHVNIFLLAFFVAKIVYFCSVFGSFHSDLYTFTGLVGLSVSLNGQPEAANEPDVAELDQSALEAFS